MGNLSEVENRLREIERIFNINLEIKNSKNQLYVGDLPVSHSSEYSHGKNILRSRKTLITGQLSKAEKSKLKKVGQSYINLFPIEVYLIKDQFILNISEQSVATKRAETRSHQRILSILDPSDVFSPYGLMIAEALMRIDSLSLQEFRSANQFAKMFSLSQPKISRLMSSTNSKDLMSLKMKLHELPQAWWEYSLSFLKTRRRLDLFYTKAEGYHPKDRLWEMEVKRQSILHTQIAGPTTVAQELGLLRESTIQIWVNEKELNSLKRDLKLIPGISQDRIYIQVAVFTGPPQKQSLVSALSLFKSNSSYFAPTIEENLLRVVWDLARGDSRQLEAALSIVRMLNGSKH